METVALQPEQKPLEPGLLDEESVFYRSYAWSLNPFLTVREIVTHLQQGLSELQGIPEDWRFAEVSTNVYLLASLLTSAVDDYLAGSVYDFSKVGRVLPFLRPLIRFIDALQVAKLQLRERRLRALYKWKRNWEAALEDYLTIFVDTKGLNRKASAPARTRILSSLPSELPTELQDERPKIPGAFRSKDLTHFDILRLADKFSAAFPDVLQPITLIGLRTAGSFFVTIFRAYLHKRGYQDVRSVTLRPKSGVTPAEASVLAESARRGALAVVIDEHPNTGITFVKTRDLMLSKGIAEDKIIFLFPVHPAHPDWANVLDSQGLSRIRTLHIEPGEWYKSQLLSPEAVEHHLSVYFRARKYRNISIVQGLAQEELNRRLPDLSDDQVLTRLKRVYEVRLETEGGALESRHVLAKSVGWGWWGYHAFLASDRLAQFIPPVLGLRDGILYMEWLPPTRSALEFDRDRNRLVGCVASYIVARTRTLRLEKDPTTDLVRQGQHQGSGIIAKVLGKAYGRVAPLKLHRIQLQALRPPCPCPTLIDGQMDRREWIDRASTILKADFEHHGLGKTELNITDPAYDVADSILHLDLSESEEKDLIGQYVQQTTDASVEQRLFLSKLLAGVWELSVTLARLNDCQFAHRNLEFNERYTRAWNFLTLQTMRFCANFCCPSQTVGWHSPLVFLDIDGVLDWKIFGFPSTTAAGVQAVSLLHAHDFAIALNSARSVREVREYCKAYGFVGGVAEYGSALWNSVTGEERTLIDRESFRQLQELEKYLRAQPGVFLDTSYRHSIRAFTYEHRGRIPLAKLFIQDVLLHLRLDRLDWHNTNIDTAIFAKGIDKGSGLLALLDWVGISELETIAVGDSETDLPMFRSVKRSFAPSQIGCRGAARRLGCQIVDRPYQLGLLSIARLLVHGDGNKCQRCSLPGFPFAHGESVFWDTLRAADQSLFTLLCKAVFDRTAFQVFLRK